MGKFFARIFLCLGTFVFSALALCQPEPAKVNLSYSNEGASLKSVFEELTKKSGVSLQAVATLHELPLVIDVKDVTLKDLMDRLARVTHAEWVKEKDGYRLRSTDKFVKQALEDSYRWRVAGYSKALEIRKKRVEAYEPFDEQAANLLALQIEAALRDKSSATAAGLSSMLEKSPSRRLMNRLINALPPELLATPADGQRLVLSARPNRMQQAFPKECLEILSQFAKEQGLWIKAVGLSGTLLESQNELTWRLKENLRQNDLSLKPILTIDAIEFTGSLEISLLMIDNHGITRSIARDAMFPTTDEPPKITITKPKPDPGEAPMEVTPLLGELGVRLWLNQIPTVSDWAPPSRALLQALLHPEKHEPMQMGVGRVFINLAKDRGLQLVACPPDAAITQTAHAHRGKLTLTMFWDQLFQYWAPAQMISNQDGWLTVTWHATSNSGSYGRPMSRTFMGKTIRQINDDGRITLDTSCKIALELNTVYSVLYDLSKAITPEVFTYFPATSPTYIAFYRLHGSLTPSQLRTLREGSKLNTMLLTPFQKDELSKMLYGTRGINNYNLPPDVVTDGPRYTNYPEATELFPNGLPTELEISCTVLEKESISIMQTTGSSPASQSSYELQSFASQIFREPDDSNMLNGATIAGYRTALTTEFSYRIAYSPTVTSGLGLSDTAPIGQWVKKYGELPEKIRTEIKKHIDIYRKHSGGGG
ncbi:MAG: hypothetical protein KF784_13130 [Fimbriimonadaceae bacterium]|nr:hypothetical protein [Fimbriimonadaceae bacterium]